MRSTLPHLRRLSLVLILFAVGAEFSGCARLPRDLQQVPSEAWQHSRRTELGRFFAEREPEDTTLSGVRLISDPAAAFRARVGLAALAEQTLDIQYYLWKGDLTGRLLMARALEAADRGVRVRILIDDIYHAGRDDVYAAIDAHPRIQIRVFNPIANRGPLRMLKFLASKRRLNRRMHNKIFLVDGGVAILGGRNIGDDYFGADEAYNFRDLDVLAVGRAAELAADAYDLYWNSRAAVPIDALRKKTATPTDLERIRESLRTSLEQQDDLPQTLTLDAQGSRARLARLRDELIWAPAEVIVDPLERFEGGAESAFVQLGNEQREEVEREMMAQSPYLIPGKAGVANLRSMAERGVRVRLLTNSSMSNNHITAHSKYRKYRKRMLKAGVELYELRADAALRDYFEASGKTEGELRAGLHAKVFVIDGERSLIGSFNMDPRSRELNSEIGLLVHSREFAQRVIEQMEHDFDPRNSYRVTLNRKGKLRWQAEGVDGEPEIHEHDPGAGFWRRLAARLLRWLPIEKEL